jgi:hypothetical protein
MGLAWEFKSSGSFLFAVVDRVDWNEVGERGCILYIKSFVLLGFTARRELGCFLL